MVSKGVLVVCSGLEMLWGMGVVGWVRCGFMVEGALVRFAHDIGVCSGRSVVFMDACHVGCMSVAFGLGSLGSLRCSVPAGGSRVDRRVSLTVRSCIFGLVLLPWGSLARMASVSCMWYVKAAGDVCLMLSRLFHL